MASRRGPSRPQGFAPLTNPLRFHHVAETESPDASLGFRDPAIWASTVCLGDQRHRTGVRRRAACARAGDNPQSAGKPELRWEKQMIRPPETEIAASCNLKPDPVLPTARGRGPASGTKGHTTAGGRPNKCRRDSVLPRCSGAGGDPSEDRSTQQRRSGRPAIERSAPTDQEARQPSRDCQVRSSPQLHAAGRVQTENRARLRSAISRQGSARW